MSKNHTKIIKQRLHNSFPYKRVLKLNAVTILFLGSSFQLFQNQMDFIRVRLEKNI